MLVLLAGCGSNTISFVKQGVSCNPSDFDDASSNCPPSACPIVGAWQNLGLVGARCNEGAIAFEVGGNVVQLTSTGWVAAGQFTTCANHARSAAFRELFASRVPADCVPACEVTFTATSEDAGAIRCVLQVEVPCSPAMGSTDLSSLSVFYYPCTP
jgi:hypothetical protein